MFKKIIITIIAVFILFLMGTGIYEKQMGILYSDGRKSILQDLKYEVTILSDGSAIVNEVREYKFLKGDFSRGYIEVEGFVDQVAVFEENESYEQMEAFDNNRPGGFYAVEPTGSKTRIEWYYNVKEKETKTFEIQYRVSNAARLYNDCVDYFQKYVGSDNQYKIKNLEVQVHLPEGANSDNTKIWAHGPSGGEIIFKNDTTVELFMKNVPPKVYVEARFLMPTKVMPPTDEKISVDRYDELYEMENKAANEGDKEKVKNGAINILTLFISIIIILLPMISSIKYKAKVKRLKPELEPDYYRDLPSNIYPAELDYLMNHYTGKYDPSVQISATLLDLIHKGVVYGEAKDKSGIKKKDTEFMNLSANWSKLSGHEKALLDFLFVKIGGGTGRVSLKEIKKFCSNKKTGKEAYSFYQDFNNKVHNIVSKKGYFETKRNALPKSTNRYIILYLFLMVLPMIMMNKIEVFATSTIFYISIAGFVGFMIVAFFGGKVKPLLTQTGENQMALWKAFQSFLNDFTTFDKKELPELFMWEKYLVYATVLGVAGKLLKQLYAKYPELVDMDQNSRLFYLINNGNYQSSYQYLGDIGNAISEAMRDSIHITSKASKGDGGGFSSGGSDSGGGAGGSSGGVD
ncbi:MAG: hypothetical protein CVU84_09850 [Firmicutes bacterium HGW-Firmicutes-1]|jgi:uncharacterized membrane protein|nr:MAG: hypothetical protein CVU84_09850 [Firmicutes bacterium HGW-Firmicutes-1]